MTSLIKIRDAKIYDNPRQQYMLMYHAGFPGLRGIQHMLFYCIISHSLNNTNNCIRDEGECYYDNS